MQFQYEKSLSYGYLLKNKMGEMFSYSFDANVMISNKFTLFLASFGGYFAKCHPVYGYDGDSRTK